MLRFHGDVEHRFDDASMERRRQVLMAAASHLNEMDGQHGFSHPIAPGKRHVGIQEHEFDAMVDDEDRRLYRTWMERQRALHAAADEVARAYDSLVAEANRRRYNLGAIESGSARS